MIRNAAILFAAPHQPVDVVLGMLSARKGGGGTGHGFRLAPARGVPTVNLRDASEI